MIHLLRLFAEFLGWWVLASCAVATVVGSFGYFRQQREERAAWDAEIAEVRDDALLDAWLRGDR